MIRSTYAVPASATHEGFWDRQLGYAHAFVTVVTLLTLGLAFHVWVGYALLAAFAPELVIALAVAPLAAFAAFARRHPGHKWVKWLTGIPVAIASTGTVGVLALAGGILPGSFWARWLGMPSPWGSWPFLMVGGFLMLNLVGSCGRRAWPLTYTNVVYLASHLGLAIALVGGAYSGLALERRTMVLFTGMPADKMQDQHNHDFAAPFAVTLREFRMDTFAPTLVVAHLDDKAAQGMRQTAGTHLLKQGTVERVDGYTVRVKKYLPKAAFDGLHWREVAWPAAAPAALISVTAPDKQTFEGWISSGSPESSPAYLPMGEKSAVFMNQPRPKKFESDLEIDGQKVTVGVNSPAHIKGYDVYQFSYDEQRGAASAYSVIELVRDRGLPVVYLGIFIMLGGAALHLWNGMGGKK